MDTDDLTTIPIERIVADVRKCIDENISVAGLALALTIPDIMGERCYPDMTYNDGDRKIGAQYARWFDKWVSRDFVDKLHWFTGEVCYELRCSVLHSASAEIDYSHSEQSGVRYRYSFKLLDDGGDSHIEHTQSNGRVRECNVHVNADHLAGAICDGVDRCLRAESERS